MKRRKREWPTGPINRKKREKVKNLLHKLNKVANENQDKSTEIKNLQETIKDLTNVE